jgi:hypothetical protein
MFPCPTTLPRPLRHQIPTGTPTHASAQRGRMCYVNVQEPLQCSIMFGGPHIYSDTLGIWDKLFPPATGHYYTQPSPAIKDQSPSVYVCPTQGPL